MKINASFQEDRLIFACKGKLKNTNDLFKIKKTILSFIQDYPQHTLLCFEISSFPIDPPLLGFLLTLKNSYLYEVQIIVTSYSNYRLLEDLYLLSKFKVQYIKEL